MYKRFNRVGMGKRTVRVRVCVFVCMCARVCVCVREGEMGADVRYP